MHRKGTKVEPAVGFKRKGKKGGILSHLNTNKGNKVRGASTSTEKRE